MGVPVHTRAVLLGCGMPQTRAVLLGCGTPHTRAVLLGCGMPAYVASACLWETRAGRPPPPPPPPSATLAGQVGPTAVGLQDAAFIAGGELSHPGPSGLVPHTTFARKPAVGRDMS